MNDMQLQLPGNTRMADAEIKEKIAQAQKGNKEVRDFLIQNNLRLVMSVVRRFNSRGFDLDDLFQIGCIGLVKAIDDFNLEYDVRFSTYAVPKIIGEIKRYIRETSSTLRVSRSLKSLAVKAIECKDQLSNELGRMPTIAEISERVGSTREEVVAALDAVTPVQSIQEVIYESDGEPLLLADQLVDSAQDHSLYLREALAELDPEERKLVMLRYFAEKSQMEVAVALGISQPQVSRMEKRILQIMRSKL